MKREKELWAYYVSNLLHTPICFASISIDALCTQVDTISPISLHCRKCGIVGASHDFGVNVMSWIALIYWHVTNWNNLQSKRFSGEKREKKIMKPMRSGWIFKDWCRKPCSSVSRCRIVKCLMQTHWKHAAGFTWISRLVWFVPHFRAHSCFRLISFW